MLLVVVVAQLLGLVLKWERLSVEQTLEAPAVPRLGNTYRDARTHDHDSGSSPLRPPLPRLRLLLLHFGTGSWLRLRDDDP